MEGAARTGTTSTGLQFCPQCTRDRVQAVAWTEAGPDHWNLQRRCPDCHWAGTGRYAQAEMERFDEALDDGMDLLLGSLRALTAERMGEDVERFLVALDRDLVLPEDF